VKILCYHRVSDEALDSQELNVSPKNFRDQMLYLKRHCTVLPLDQWKKGGDGIAMTFDDGYFCVLNLAWPILQELEIPATFFIASGFVETPSLYFWDELEQELVRKRGMTVFEYRSICAGLKNKTEKERQPALDALVQPRYTSTPYSTMDRKDLFRLGHSELATIGAHTVDHILLADLYGDEQVYQIHVSKAYLEDVLCKKVDQFSYPYGGPETFNDVTKEVLKTQGFSLAVTTIKGEVGRTTDPMALPRYVIRNWAEKEFSEQVSI
jgi:peptidoglycan/xylan/chitin deacetylase (PgdA/CDA1 family)